MHGKAVRGVQYRRNAGQTRGHPSYEAGFRGVGVDDVELFRSDEAVELPKGDEVLWGNGAADIDRKEGDVGGLDGLKGVEVRGRGVGDVKAFLFQLFEKGNEEGPGGDADSRYFQYLFQALLVGDRFAAVVLFELAVADVARAEAVVAAAVALGLGDLDGLGGRAHHGRIFRGVFQDNGVGAYNGVVADGYGADYFGARADEDIVANRRNPRVVHLRLSDDHLGAYDAV